MKRRVSPSRLKGTVLPALSSSMDFTFTPAGSFMLTICGPGGVDRLHPAVVRVGVGVIEKVDGVAGGGRPCEEFDETFTVDMDDTLIAGDPADSVVQEPEEIAVAGEPVSMLNVSWKPGDATGACLADHD